MLSFIRGIETFESPLFFGTPAGITVITTEIYNSINHRATPDYQYATALSFAIMALMFLLVLWQWRLLRGAELRDRHRQGLSRRTSSSSGRGAG